MTKNTIAYIVTTRPERQSLLTCLSSIYNQKNHEKPEIYVASIDKHSWYEQSNRLVELTKADWLCFPNDDCYLMPVFTDVLLSKAIVEKAELVFCDIIYDTRAFGHYDVLRTTPYINYIDKISFIVKRTTFKKLGGFPNLKNIYITDGTFVETVKKSGAHIVKATGVLAVHN